MKLSPAAALFTVPPSRPSSLVLLLLPIKRILHAAGCDILVPASHSPSLVSNTNISSSSCLHLHLYTTLYPSLFVMVYTNVRLVPPLQRLHMSVSQRNHSR
eukprot:scaffold1043_cov95-Skeletonema_marinoi.AAC.1